MDGPSEALDQKMQAAGFDFFPGGFEIARNFR